MTITPMPYFLMPIANSALPRSPINAVPFFKALHGAANFFTARLVTTLCAAVFLTFGGAVHAQVNGAGSTLVRDLMSGWAMQYGPASGGVTYEALGSSAGVLRATEQSIDFGVSDVPLTAAALRQAGLRQVPLAGAAVAVIVNLPELSGKSIKLSGDVLAEIYQGSVTQWNHSLIAGSNPGLALPNRVIVPIWRADGSGQSHVFSTYLSRGNSKWRRVIGPTNNLALTAGRSVRGGQAMLEAVKATPGAVGYESLGAAQKASLGVAELLNSSGKFIAPNAVSISAALESAQWLKDSNAADLDGSAGLGTYPMTAVPYALIPVAPKKGRVNALPFIQTAVAQGDPLIRQSGFFPLPVVAKALTSAAR